MQDWIHRVPDVNRYWTTYPNGTVSNIYRDSASKVYAREVTSTGKPFPKVRPLPNNPYTIVYQEYNVHQSAIYKYTDGRTIQAMGGYLSRNAGGIDFFPHVDWDYLRERALEDLNEKVRGSLDLSVDIAQARQVRKMANLTSRVEDYSRVFSRRFGVIKSLANGWLEYVYGVKPLLSSIYGVADELIRITINKQERHKGRSKVYLTPTSAGLNTIDGVWDAPVFGFHKAAMTMGMSLTTEDDFSLSRFTSLNPYSIAWELMPYSFVADWFLNVGGYLRNLETALLYRNRFRGGYTTYVTAAELQISKKFSGSDIWSGLSSYEAIYTGSIKARYIQRIPLSSYPLPLLPSLNADLGSSRLLSAASLLAGGLKSGGNPARRQTWQNHDVQDRVRKYQSKPDVPVWQQGYEHL